MQRPCVMPGCDGLVSRGRLCTACLRNRRPVRTESAASRGYDNRWAARARRYRGDNPICEWPVKMAAHRVLRRADAGCPRCMAAAAHVDHIWPTARPTGMERDDELQALCKSHHSYKTVVYDRDVPRR